MNAILLIILVFAGYIIAYKTYGRYLSKKIFKVSDRNIVPSHEFQDGIDYVPTDKSIIFGHHFTTIAGLGPIIGPAIGIIWGWLPALMWVFFGSIFMGAVHDYATLIISARNKGKTIGELTGNVLNPGSRIAFQLIMQVLLTIVLSVFALIVSTLFVLYPESVIPIWLQIPIAILLGRIIKRGGNKIVYSIIAIILMYVTIYIGMLFPINIAELPFLSRFAGNQTQLFNIVAIIWCLILFIYVSIASVLPVGVLLQPRDFINSLQLFIAIVVIVLGVFVANPIISAPAINSLAFEPGNDVPAIAPVLFIIIACGAISGFHSIASSGTTVKQLDKESDGLFIGFGSMLTEGFLAVLVIICATAGLGLGFDFNGEILKGSDAFYHYYSSWSATQGGISNNIQSFVIGTTNLLAVIGIPREFSAVMIAVFIVSFANTTLDSAARIQRLSMQELVGEKRKFLNNRYISTIIVILLAGIITFLKPGGAGAKILWPLFGSMNQLLAALGLAVVTVYMHQKGKKYILFLVPMLFILIMTLWSMGINLFRSIQKADYVLITISFVILALTGWLLFSGLKTIIRNRIT
ncbi:MAG: carbon starvation protein A [Bacteroidales bacterium]|nr:carbon starvation protein A [Bacteroidales bacterium]MBN2820157.1 carbon starvation protein A [Bacteroidales bacterium]